jgi:DNA-binding CsgD family transcriptional regulator
MPDLSSLNEAERTVLGLLAQGHTAKSIAAATGRSEASVNERLREARRKTGVGSSRELARLHAAQQIRDEQIGVAPPDGADASLPGTAATGGGRSKGLIVMSLTGLTIAAAAALLMPGVQDAAGPGTASEAMRKAFVLQGRDAVWADRAEAALRARYAAIPEVSASLKIVCATAQCLVTADFKPDDAVMQRLQAPDVAGGIADPKLKNHESSFEVANGGRGTMRYTAWWLREGS